VEASALRHTARLPALAGHSPLLRLQTDEKLIVLVRRGDHGAFEALVQRYQPRLLAFCRHMLGSQEDAEDVLQEVFAASFNAICADKRPINARPWLYRIARNRCLNHLRRPQPSGQDSMDVFERDGGASTADTVHKREEFLHLVADVQELPETQRTALLLREIDALSYDQIAETMDTTVPSVKSLLVRARVSLAEAAESRLLTCEEVRLELGQVAEGFAKTSAPARRHLRSCERCRVFKGELRKTTRALAAVYPIGPFVFLKKLSLAKLGIGGAASGAASGGATTGGAGIAGTAATAAGGMTAGGAVSAGVGTIASKAAAGFAAAAIVTAGAVEVRHATTVEHHGVHPTPIATAPRHAAPKPAPPVVQVAKAETPRQAPEPEVRAAATTKPNPVQPEPEPETATSAPTQTTPAPPPPAPEPGAVEEDHSTVTLPPAQEPQEPPESPPPPPAETPSPGQTVPAPPPPEEPGSQPTPNPPPGG
jgi:RNA polymerase sigma factor (sigma-70 family)